MIVSPIEQLLTRLAVEWRKGYMVCPKCHEKKLTASEQRNVATCWACHEQFYPGKKAAYKVSWAKTLLNILGDQSLKNLANAPETVTWFSEQRKLECSAEWLKAHMVGAFPRGYDPTRAIERGKEVLEADFDRLCAQAQDNKEREKLQREKKAEEELFKIFCEEKLIPACQNESNNNAAVFVYTNSHSDPLSLNIRQWQKEKAGDKKKYITR